MEGIWFFWVAFGLSLMGSLPFGMINLNILSTAVYRGRTAAMIMGLGAVVTEGCQLVLILAGYDLLSDNPGIERWLRAIAFPLFLGLAIYFFMSRPKADVKEEQNGTPFWKGVGLSMINILVYPFWLFWLTWLDFPVENKMLWTAFIGGAVGGAYFSLLAFILMGHVIARQGGMWTRHLNRFIALVFMGLALMELFRWIW